MPATRRGIWAETAPPEALRDAATWRLLARCSLEVALAVRPPDLDSVGAWTDLAAEHGVRASLWPMIDDAAGRWLSVASAEPFRELLQGVQARAPGAEIVLDLEPPLPLVRGALDGRREAALGLLSMVRGTPEHAEGERVIASICEEVRAVGAPLTVAIVPFVLFDAAERPGWGRLFGPSRPLPATRVNAMLYSTLIEGYSRGVLRRADALALLSEGCRAAVSRFGDRAAVSLGAVGTGALGDEPVYEDPAELSVDVAVAEACGVRDLWLFDLGGVLARGAPESWLEAFVAPGARAPIAGPTARARVVSALLRWTGRALAAGASGAGGAPGVAEHGTIAGRV